MKKRILERNEGKDDDNDETITKRIKIWGRNKANYILIWDKKDAY